MSFLNAPILVLAAVIVRRTEAYLQDLDDNIVATLHQMASLRGREPADERDRERYWEHLTALRCYLVEREAEWAVNAAWLAWARAYLMVRPLVQHR